LTGITAKGLLATAASTGDSTYVATKKAYDAAIKALEVKEAEKVWATQNEAALKKIDEDYKKEEGVLK
jgi:hypothetical protein